MGDRRLRPESSWRTDRRTDGGEETDAQPPTDGPMRRGGSAGPLYACTWLRLHSCKRLIRTQYGTVRHGTVRYRRATGTCTAATWPRMPGQREGKRGERRSFTPQLYVCRKVSTVKILVYCKQWVRVGEIKREERERQRGPDIYSLRSSFLCWDWRHSLHIVSQRLSFFKLPSSTLPGFISDSLPGVYSQRYAKIQTTGMLDSGSKQTLVGFSPSLKSDTLPARHGASWTRERPRRSLTTRHGERLLGKWKYSARKMFSGTSQLLPPVSSSYLGLEGLPRRCVGRGRGRWLDPACPHVGEELVGDLGQDVLGEAGHAQDVVPRPVDVIPERDELGGEKMEISLFLRHKS